MTWNEILQNEISQEYYQNGIAPFLRQEYAQFECYPSKDNIFKAFYSIPSPENVKVVILGQDPYHEPGQANGLAFSVQRDCVNPPSLNNIIDEVQHEFNVQGINAVNYGDLTCWAKQGVLLLNTTLTVRRGQANSHSGCGWTTFTDHIIQYLNSMNQPMVFMLWGKYAQRKKYLVNNNKILVLTTSHPSPFSANRGFFGCNHFVKCNEYLKANNIQPIDWTGGAVNV